MGLEKGKENGVTFNAGLGGEYKLGTSAIFYEAVIALPAHRENWKYRENIIPTNLQLNAGIRFDLTKRKAD